MFLLYSLQTHMFQELALEPSQITIITLVFAQASFFATGNTNSISSLDLSNAYNGVSSYSPYVVGFLLFVGNWSGPIYWSFTGLYLILEESSCRARFIAIHKTEDRRRLSAARMEKIADKMAVRAWKEHVTMLSFFMSATAFGVMLACTVLRTHLFVWTVFTPKFLYAAAWLAGWHLGCNVLLGGVLAWMA